MDGVCVKFFAMIRSHFIHCSNSIMLVLPTEPYPPEPEKIPKVEMEVVFFKIQNYIREIGDLP